MVLLWVTVANQPWFNMENDMMKCCEVLKLL